MDRYKPSSKEIVTELMQFLGKESKQIPHHKGTNVVTKEYIKYKCPETHCPSTIVTFLDKSRVPNPYMRLRRCCGKGESQSEEENILVKMYQEAKQSSKLNIGSILSHFNVQTLTDYDKMVYGYLKLITGKSLPISYISDPEARSLSKLLISIGKPGLTSILLNIVEVVEQKIVQNLSNKKGAVLFDGWSGGSTHYIGLTASYCKEVTVLKDGNEAKIFSPTMVIPSTSPMGHIEKILQMKLEKKNQLRLILKHSYNF